MANIVSATSVKVLCSVCGFFVNPNNHEQRCNPDGVSRKPTSDKWSEAKLSAWLGDVMHRQDMQLLAIILEIPDKERETFVQSHCSGHAQQQWWNSFSNQTVSEKTASKRFESQYPELRSRYLKSLGENLTASEIDSVLTSIKSKDGGVINFEI